MKLFQAAGIIMFLVSAGDAITTLIGLRVPGLYEWNPLMSNELVMIVAHVLAPIYLYWYSNRIRRAGGVRTSLVMRLIFVLGVGYAAINNLHLIHSQGGLW